MRLDWIPTYSCLWIASLASNPARATANIEMPEPTTPERLTLHRFSDDGTIPNSDLPLLAYRTVLEDEVDLASAFEELFAANNWCGSWRNGIYCFRHYHSRAHEVLGIARGHARVEFGGPDGEELEAAAGDAVVIPAGVSHYNLGASDDLLVIGAYPAAGSPDLCRDSLRERNVALLQLESVALPTTDPVYGVDGPLMRAWRP